MTTSPGAVGVSLYRYLRRYQCYYGNCVYQHGGVTFHDNFLAKIEFNSINSKTSFLQEIVLFSS